MIIRSLTKFQSRRALGVTGLLSFSLLNTAGVFAQSATVPSYLPEKEEVVNLEKFEVTGQRDEKAYAVSRSITGTKTDTALVNVPKAVTVITRALIDDTAMLSIGDVTRFVPGVGIAQGEGNRDTPVLRGNSTTADFFLDGIRAWICSPWDGTLWVDVSTNPTDARFQLLVSVLEHSDGTSKLRGVRCIILEASSR